MFKLRDQPYNTLAIIPVYIVQSTTVISMISIVLGLVYYLRIVVHMLLYFKYNSSCLCIRNTTSTDGST